MKPSEPQEKAWKGEAWDDSIINHMPRPGDHVRSVIFDAARQQAAAGVSPSFISRVFRWRLIPAFGTASVLLLAAVLYVQYQDKGQIRGIAGLTDPAVEEMVKYVISTEELKGVIAETAEVDSADNQDLLLNEISEENELLALLEEAHRLGAVMVTLEVRVSNTSAQTLYTKFGFQQAGRRKAYYHDNGEDALILTTPHLESVEYWNLVESNRAKLLEQLPYPNNEQDCTTKLM